MDGFFFGFITTLISIIFSSLALNIIQRRRRNEIEERIDRLEKNHIHMSILREIIDDRIDYFANALGYVKKTTPQTEKWVKKEKN